VTYGLDNALFQWQDGETRLRDAPEPAVRAADAVLEELRRRLGGSFLIGELVDLYSRGTDWATDLARSEAAGSDAAAAVDAAFARYAREASDYAGGRARESHGRP
jgi:hypothetical protein